MELNREQIVKALECCAESTCCEECPVYGFCNGQEWLVENALALHRELTEDNEKLTINMNAYGLTAKRLAEENERLQAKIAHLEGHREADIKAFKTLKTDTVRKMQERLEASCDAPHWCVWLTEIEQIAQEMLEEG